MPSNLAVILHWLFLRFHLGDFSSHDFNTGVLAKELRVWNSSETEPSYQSTELRLALLTCTHLNRRQSVSVTWYYEKQSFCFSSLRKIYHSGVSNVIYGLTFLQWCLNMDKNQHFIQKFMLLLRVFQAQKWVESVRWGLQDYTDISCRYVWFAYFSKSPFRRW